MTNNDPVIIIMRKQIFLLLTFSLLTLFLLIFKSSIQKEITSFFINKNRVNELATTEFVNKIIGQTGEYNYQVKTAYFAERKIPIPESLAILPVDQNVLGLKAYATEGEKWIEVDLTNQKLYAHEGGNIVYEFPISSGFPWTPTVTGEFRIWTKLKYTRMAGGCEINDCYDLPNVPYTQYFYKGYSLHGTYWHNDFGRPRSHGCVNLRIPDAEKLYYWTSPPVSEGQSTVYPTRENPGTRVVIYGQAKI